MQIDTILQEELFIVNKYPKEKTLNYGTSGFRMNADYLPYVMHRLGIFCNFYANKIKG
jgi:hypothetical protein